MGSFAKETREKAVEKFLKTRNINLEKGAIGNRERANVKNLMFATTNHNDNIPFDLKDMKKND